jgi:hypothetical protein
MKLKKEIVNNREFWFGPDKAIYSMVPPYSNLCFNYFLPDSYKNKILQLGVCGNSFRYLLKEKFPKSILMDVDIEDYSENSDNFVQLDALEFLRTTSELFDYSVVDISKNTDVDEIIFDEEFQIFLKTKSLSGVINCGTYEKEFVHLKCTKKIKAENNILYFWER